MKNLYNKIAEWLCSFRSDKYVHFIIMLIFTFLFAKLMKFVFTYTGCNYPILLATGSAVLIGLIVSFGKEEWDLKREGVYEKSDVIANIIGIISGCLMSII